MVNVSMNSLNIIWIGFVVICYVIYVLYKVFGKEKKYEEVDKEKELKKAKLDYSLLLREYEDNQLEDYEKKGN